MTGALVCSRISVKAFLFMEGPMSVCLFVHTRMRPIMYIHVIMVRRRQRTLSVHCPLWEYFGVDREKYYGAEVDELEEE